MLGLPQQLLKVCIHETILWEILPGNDLIEYEYFSIKLKKTIIYKEREIEIWPNRGPWEYDTRSAMERLVEEGKEAEQELIEIDKKVLFKSSF